MTIDRYANGHFSWVDLSTPDLEAAVDFYGNVLGWTAMTIPLPDGGHYVTFTKDGKLVAGAGELDSDADASEVPPTWTSYLNVDDADATVASVSGAGGDVVVPAMDVMDQGRMAILTDPHGAVFGVWQAAAHHGAERVNEAGSLIWNELITPDLNRPGFVGDGIT